MPEPTALAGSGVGLPVALGVVLALVVHLTKALARPVVTAATLGVGGPVVSTAEDVTSLALGVAALLAPVLVVVLLVGVVVAVVRLLRHRPPRRSRPDVLDGPAAP